jgi:1,4-dihydroxy-2-naphthoate octaprenyltransferase
MRKKPKKLGPARVPFLALPPVCALLGVSTALWETGKVNLWYALLALIGAVSSHVSVNSFNEYMDFKSGLDTKTTRTLFSGGSGTLVEHPHLVWWALTLGVITLLMPALSWNVLINLITPIPTAIGIIAEQWPTL